MGEENLATSFPKVWPRKNCTEKKVPKKVRENGRVCGQESGVGGGAEFV